MKTLAFSVYDEKVQAFNAPFFNPTIGSAARLFEDLVKDESSRIHAHPADYSLYRVGSFDDSSGNFESVVPPELVGRGSDFLQARPAELKVRRVYREPKAQRVD